MKNNCVIYFCNYRSIKIEVSKVNKTMFYEKILQSSIKVILVTIKNNFHLLHNYEHNSYVFNYIVLQKNLK